MNKPLSLDPFYLIVDHVTWLERLLPLGVRLVQLRIKEGDHAELKSQIQQAKRLCKHYQCQLIINDYWQLALDLGCDFVHLGQEDVQDADLVALRQAGVRIGISSHSPEELEQALALAADYIALGPIYPTLLKKMPWQPQGLQRITQWKQAMGDIPLVAIGGLSPERLAAVFQAGANSAAVVTDILKAESPEARTQQWLQATQDIRQC